MRLPLRTKFSSLVLVIILIMMSAIWILTINQQSEMEQAIGEQQRLTMQNELMKRAGNIFSFLAANSEALAIGDYLTVDAFVRDILTSKDISFVQIVKDGRVVVPIRVTGDETSALKLPMGVLPAGESVRFDLVEIDPGEPLLVASGPIIDKSINVRVADVYVGISRKPVQEAILSAYGQIKFFGRTARANITYATGVFAVLGVIASILLVTYVVRPIKVLAEGAKIIGRGNLDHQVLVRTNDEVGDLAQTFNRMTQNLKDDRAQLVEKEKLDQELKIATQIQQTLLPKLLPQVPGYQFGAIYTAAREVGGDYYDFLQFNANGHTRIGIVVADVSGKGVPGAFLMAVTRSILRANASRTNDPENVLKSTNAILQPDIKKGMFVSMFYGLLDIESGQLEFGSAGHLPTLVYKSSSNEIQSIRCKGMALGLGNMRIFDQLLETRRVVLDPGDVLFQFTDGVTDAVNAAGERFGTRRLIDAVRQHSGLQPQKFVDRILEQVITFTSGSPQFDDITMVAVKRSPRESGG